MILGRNAALWVGVVAALLNVAVIVLGVPLTTEGLAALNAAAAAVIGLVANVSDPTTARTLAPTIRPPGGSGAGSSIGAASSPGSPTSPTGGASVAGSSGPTGGSGGA